MPHALDVRTKYKMRRLLYGRVTVCIVLVLCVFAGNATWGMFQTSREAAAKKEEAAAEFARLEARKTQLEAAVAHLSSAKGVETELRERYMVAKEGEQVIVIPDQSVASNTDMEAPKPSFWKKISERLGL